MKISVKVDIDTAKILQSRGLGGDHSANKFIANEVKRLSDPYTPFRQGDLMAATIQPGAPARLEYDTPYAHYQWTGLVMGGRAPRHYTGAALTYYGGGMRGPRWTERAMADRGPDVVRSLANYVGGKPG